MLSPAGYASHNFRVHGIQRACAQAVWPHAVTFTRLSMPLRPVDKCFPWT
jgi:hypothetical protein